MRDLSLLKYNCFLSSALDTTDKGGTHVGDIWHLLDTVMYLKARIGTEKQIGYQLRLTHGSIV